MSNRQYVFQERRVQTDLRLVRWLSESYYLFLITIGPMSLQRKKRRKTNCFCW